MSSRDPLDESFDRFTLPGRIPDASDPYWRLSPDEQANWRARGLAHPAGRGWTPIAGSGGPVPLGGGSDEGRVRPAPGKGPWPQDWLPGDPPVRFVDADALGYELEGDPAADMRKFDAPARVRFLDCLATLGEVRAAAARVGVSRETCYRARRRWPDFARLWDAAMLHARARAEGELASRAYDGVKTPVFLRGECVATWNRHDPRYLSMLLARLDRKAEACPEAAETAERFEALLALHAGHAAPEGFADAAGLWDEDRDVLEDDNDFAAGRAPLPTRREYVAWFSCRAAEKASARNAERVAMKAAAEAGAAWDAWHESARAEIDAIVEAGAVREGQDARDQDAASPLPPAGEAGGGPVDLNAGEREEPVDPPFEVKSAPAHWRPSSVSHVSTPPAPLRGDERGGQERGLPHVGHVSPQQAETGAARSVHRSRGGAGHLLPSRPAGVASPPQESCDE